METMQVCLPTARLAWPLLAGWIAVVLIHGIWRSLGGAAQDPIRPSGPGGI